jgi:hypothetical protein
MYNQIAGPAHGGKRQVEGLERRVPRVGRDDPAGLKPGTYRLRGLRNLVIVAGADSDLSRVPARDVALAWMKPPMHLAIWPKPFSPNCGVAMLICMHSSAILRVCSMCIFTCRPLQSMYGCLRQNHKFAAEELQEPSTHARSSAVVVVVY